MGAIGPFLHLHGGPLMAGHLRRELGAARWPRLGGQRDLRGSPAACRAPAAEDRGESRRRDHVAGRFDSARCGGSRRGTGATGAGCSTLRCASERASSAGAAEVADGDGLLHARANCRCMLLLVHRRRDEGARSGGMASYASSEQPERGREHEQRDEGQDEGRNADVKYMPCSPGLEPASRRERHSRGVPTTGRCRAARRPG